MTLSRLFSLIGLLLTLATAALVWRVADTQWAGYQHASRSLEAVSELRAALSAAEMLSRERGPANAVLGDAAPPLPERAAALAAARARTDHAFDELQGILARPSRDPSHQDAMERFADARRSLHKARTELDQVAAIPLPSRRADDIRQAVRNMVEVVPRLTPAIRTLSRDAQEGVPQLADSLSGARLSSELREYAGQLGSLFIPALARQQPFTSDERDAIQRVRGRIEVLRDQVELRVQVPEQAPGVRAAYEAMKEAYFGAGRQLLDRTIASGLATGDFGMDPAAFTSLYVPRMNAIVGLRDALLDDARAVATQNRDAVRLRMLVVLAGAAGLVAVLAASIWLLNLRVLRPLALTTRALQALARGDHDAPLPQARARDEIAEVVAAVVALRRHSLDRVTLERERDELIARLRDQSGTDFLTGLTNRRAFMPAALREMALSRRHGFSVAAVVLDIDHFKRINDTHGHAVGDQVLSRLSATLRSLLREGDLLARFGGEEFVVLLSQCDIVAAALFAQRLCDTVAATPVRWDGGPDLHVTASLGVAESRKGAELELDRLLQRADQAMYRAKQAGRNRVEVDDA